MPDESPYGIEPCLLDEYPAKLADTLGNVMALSTTLGQRLHPTSAVGLAELVG